MQDSWCQWANRALARDGQTFERGRPKAETRAEHLSPEDYRRSLDMAAERERDGPWPELVGRVVAVFDGGKDKGKSNEREMVEWLHEQRERRLGKPRDSDRIAADLDLLTDGKLSEHELQFAARDIEAKLDREARPGFGGGRGSRGGFGGR